MSPKLLGESKDFIIYMDICGFSIQEPSEQRTWYNHLEKAVKKIVDDFNLIYSEKTNRENRINSYLNSLGDGFIIVLSGKKFKNKLIPFQIVISILDEINHKGFKLKFGIHYGPNDWMNSQFGVTNYPLVIGTGINDCSRVVSFGHKNHIMLTDDYCKDILIKTKEYTNQIDDKNGHLYKVCNLGNRAVKHNKEIHLHYAFREEDKEEFYGCSDTPIKGTIKEESIKKGLIAQLKSFSTNLNKMLVDFEVPKRKRQYKISVLVRELTPNGDVLAALDERINENGDVLIKKSNIEFTKNVGLPSLVIHGKNSNLGILLPRPEIKGKLNPKYAKDLKDICNLNAKNIRAFCDYSKTHGYRNLPRTFISILLYFENKKFGILSIDSKYVWMEKKEFDRFCSQLSDSAFYIKNIGAALTVQ